MQTNFEQASVILDSKAEEAYGKTIGPTFDNQLGGQSTQSQAYAAYS